MNLYRQEPLELLPLKLKTFGISDVGLVRSNNEDAWSEMVEVSFFALADGMGGHKAGEIAAQLAVKSLCKFVEEAPQNPSVESVVEILREGFYKANELIFNLGSRDKKLQGMGTTLCCMMLSGSTLVHAHVGDSRVYRFREGRLEQLTQDHSRRNELLLKGKLTEKEAFHYPYKNRITRAIGTHLGVEVAIGTTPFLPEDLYFLCSDGLSDYVIPEEMVDVLKENIDISKMGEELIALAKQKGGHDNITLVLIKIGS